MFIVLDGPDGGGKTTQVARLKKRLEGLGRTVTAVREPGGTPLGEKIREILLDPKMEISLRAELMLFMACRAELVQKVILPSLDFGDVITDRFGMSSVVYQGIVGGVGFLPVEAVNHIVTAGLKPLTIVLDVPYDVALKRRSKRQLKDRFEEKGERYHKLVREGFLKIAATAENTDIIDASGPEDKVADYVWAIVGGIIEGNRP